ncbi:MAG: hypothetical protein P4L35_09485 [Ignavibacteriaceae bacterium]|nr:hypothetical protein [Ignavibacteriaceae bacterium]
MKFVYGSEHLGCARISARIKDVKSRYKVEIIGWHEENNSSLYWYQLVNNEILLEEIPEYSAYNGGQGKLI